jgi:hypothetical protein
MRKKERERIMNKNENKNLREGKGKLKWRISGRSFHLKKKSTTSFSFLLHFISLLILLLWSFEKMKSARLRVMPQYKTTFFLSPKRRLAWPRRVSLPGTADEGFTRRRLVLPSRDNNFR